MYTKSALYFIIVAVIVLATLGAWYWQSRKVDLVVPVVPAQGKVTSAEQLGGELLEKAQNPLKGELPSVNPFTQAETNPFVDVYKNPFAR